MSLPEPPYDVEDTQPNLAVSSRDTLPNRRSYQRQMLPSWVLAVLIVGSVVSLVLTITTLGITWQRGNTPEVRLQAVSISLRVAGEQSDITTTALTVADVLNEQNVVIGANDAVAPASETLLTDGMIITVARAREVTLVLDDETRTIETPHEHPAAILTDEGITLGDFDRVWLDSTSVTQEDLAIWPVPVDEITIQRAYDITIVDGDTETTLQTTADTVGDALFDAGVSVFLTDNVEPSVETSLSADTTITIDRAVPVSINVDGTTIETRVQGGTVADALSEAGIALLGLDYTIPAETDAITPDLTINVLRVTESTETTDTPIPYETTYQADSTLELDQRAIIQSGQTGTERLTERVRFENGEEVAREPISTEIITSVQNEIVAYGTNIVLRTVDTPEGPREYWRVIRAYATSYHPEALGGDDVTAIGATLQFGIIAANPDIIPYRTDVFVPRYGVGMMADTGGTRSSPYWIDLGYGDDDWVSWSQYVDVYLLTPIPAEVDYLLPNVTPMRGIPDN